MAKKPLYENHLHKLEARWFAIYTPYKREKRALELLRKKHITAYLPLQRIARHYNRKVKWVELPLISNYLFVKITKDEYVKVLQTDYVNNFIHFHNNLVSIPEEEILLLQRILGEEMEVTAERQFFYEGDQVEIVSGNLAGVQGRLLKVNGKSQVLVDLSFLGYTLQLHIDPALLRKKQASDAFIYAD
ncbi:MAG: UpxY family transcription antiterminator [Bacteroidota bacterium]